MAQPLASPYSQFFDANGIPLNGGKIYTYAAGTTTPQASYTDSTGTVAAANPVILDSAGRATIWLSGTYKIVVKDSLDNTLVTTDNISASSSTTNLPWAVAGGSADAITVTYNPAISTLTDGLELAFRASAANATTTPTFSPNGLTAHTITQKGGSPLIAGNIAANLAEYIVTYNLANTRWELLNPTNTIYYATGQLQRTSSTQVALMPYKGNQISFPNGYVYTIGSSGLASGSISGGCNLNGTPSSSLTAATLYYCYLWYNSGTPAIDFSATGHATDTSTGIEIKSGDSTRVLIGMVYPQTGPVVVDSTATRLVASWNNRQNKSFSNGFTTTRTTTSASMVEINSEIRGLFLTWGDGLQAAYTGSLQNSVSNGNVKTCIGLDGVSTIIAQMSANPTSNAVDYAFALPVSYGGASEGQHYITIGGLIAGGNTLSLLNATGYVLTGQILI